MSRSAVVTAVAGMLFYCTSPSLASAALATATLGWDAFEITLQPRPSGVTPTLALSSPTTALNVNARTTTHSFDFDTHLGSDWTSSVTVDADTPIGKASTTASDSILSAVASSTGSLVPNHSLQSNNARAIASRSADFLLDGPALVLFSIPYSLEVQRVASPREEGVDARVSASLLFFTEDASSVYEDADAFSLDTLQLGNAFHDGALVLTLLAEGPGAGLFNFAADAFAASIIMSIPEPHAILNLLVVLTIIVTMVKRSNASN